jgi:hypothetical protein
VCASRLPQSRCAEPVIRSEPGEPPNCASAAAMAWIGVTPDRFMIELLPCALRTISKRMIRSAEDLMAGIPLQHRLHGRPLL